MKASGAEFIFSKIPSFQHILLNPIRRMSLNYENCSLMSILFQTLKQYADYKSLFAKTFDENTLKMNAISAIQVIKNKKQCFQFFLHITSALVLSAHILACPIGRASKIARRKSRAFRKKFVHPCLRLSVNIS